MKQCINEGCEQPARARLMCFNHWRKVRRRERGITKGIRDYTVGSPSLRVTYKSEYGSYVAMRTRTRNPNCPKFHLYGGRGISITPKWDTFAAFLADMGPKPGPEYSIDRIDVDGNYEPGNCRWATPREQRINQRRNKNTGEM